ncbi:UpxY family transcription antiterminator [Saccharicrinis fermentans]|uniref:Transcription antitermination protein NusG n=1 Tax=Saccharicrinis fermentans DSM 9555 = JCM 21142 TaxID=869213 RepID=W7Y245_9BACT|nr:UpxY family transcription antiterminator [Saccharicrinis fermentans]GAF04950.1 transcription antitermination protein NusG [Saccharicrinis fermentans DSM 9555 = JCM 21142]
MKKDTTTTHTWYALYTKSRAEKKVAEGLEKLGVINYLPLKKELKQWSDRKKWVEVPAISSYIFIKITADQYRSVFAVNGVVAYVSHKGNALAIPEHEIIAMQRTIENKINFNVVAGDIKKGEEITVTSGPLCGIKGIVQTVQGTKKLYLNISNIGYTLVVDLQEASVEKQ